MYFKSIKLPKIYNLAVFFLLFIFGLAKNIGRYSLSSDFYFLRNLLHSNEYVFYIPYIFLFLLPLIDKDWKNKFFLIPIIFGHAIFGGTSSVYFISRDIFGFNEIYFFSILLYAFLLVISYIIGFFLYNKKLWALYTYLIFFIFLLVIIIVIPFLNESAKYLDDVWTYILPPFLIALIIYFYFIIKKLRLTSIKGKINFSP